MRSIGFILLILSFFLPGCDKEITIDYRSVDNLYVVEGHLNHKTAEVLITHTRDMGNPVKIKGIEATSVVISTNDGEGEVLKYGDDGYYRSVTGLVGDPGTTYTLTVKIDSKEYSSSSTMQKQAAIESATFQWQKFLNDRFLLFVVEVRDIAGEENYYCYRMYRNGEIYHWNLFRDKGNDGKVITLNISCMGESEAEENKKENQDDILYEEDEIDLEIRTIDLKTYNYLYSLGLSERTSSNPIVDFSGGCLGYFSAYSSVQYNTVFRYKDIVP